MTVKQLHKKGLPVIVEVGPGLFVRGFYQRAGRMGTHFVASKKGGRAGWWVSEDKIRKAP